MYFKHYKKPDVALTKSNYKKALKLLEKNIRYFDVYNKPVLSTGEGYPGLWAEHNHDFMFYVDYNPEVAKNSHRLFYHIQRHDGLYPASAVHWPDATARWIYYNSLQIVYPLAASAYYVAKKTGDEEFLVESYDSWKRYDEWIWRNRNTRGTGLVEMFCSGDTGHDRSMRVADLPKFCLDGNAANCPDNPILPIISPDLSACIYRGEIALAEMAEDLGMANEADRWRNSAGEMKERLMKVCYDAEDEFFYDVDATGKFRKFLGEHIFRLFVNGIVEQPVFDKIFNKYIMSDKHFCPDYPFSSVSVSEPKFDLFDCQNCWNGMSQTHTALETVYWMEQYGKADIHKEYMEMMVSIFNDSDMKCTQEINPFTGEFSNTAPNFTTSLIMYTEFVKRLGILDK